MEFRKTRKGFTIVELVIVIAVIGILSAILIPTFIHLTNKAEEASDKSLVTNLNTSLRVQEAFPENSKARNLHEAVELLKKQGYYASQLIAKSEQEIVYSVDDDCFYLSNDEKVDQNNKHKYFRVYDTMPTDQTWSIYANDGWDVSSIPELHVGFDNGDASTVVSSMTYVGNGNEDKEVVIRTNGGTLTINAEHDKVYHYGVANFVDVQKVDTASYYENGKATFIKIALGRVVVGEGADVQVGGIHVAADGVIVAVATGADLPTVTFDSAVTTFYVQTTDEEGEKTTQSTVTIDGGVVSTTATSGSDAVPTAIATQIENSQEATEAEALAEACNVVEPTFDENVVARIGLETYESLAQAVTNASNGDKIVVVNDDNVSLTNALTNDQEIKINKSITITGLVNEDGSPKFTIYGTNNSSRYNDLFIKNQTSAINVTIENLKFSQFGNNASTNSNHSVICVSGSTHADTHTILKNVYIDKFNKAGVIISNGTYAIEDCYIDCAKPKTHGNVLTKGFDIQTRTTNNTITRVEVVYSDSTYDEWSSAAFEIYYGGCTLTDCTVTSFQIAYASAYDADITLNNCSANAVSAISLVRKNATTNNTSKATVNGGTYTGALNKPDENQTLTITGGTFSEDPTAYVDTDNYDVTNNGNGTYTVSAKA